MHSEKVTVWFAVAYFDIGGHFFFEKGGVTVTVSFERYSLILQHFLQLQINNIGIANVWFQQERATACTA